MRVTSLRNFFLIPENYKINKSVLVHRFEELTRKIWHARNFKGQVSPHEFLQAVMKASKKRFRIGAQSDPVEFMSWLLNTLHTDLRTSKRNISIIHQCFQGELEVVKENGTGANGGTEVDNIVRETSRMPFLMLGLDLLPPPLFKDVMEKNIIPQASRMFKFNCGAKRMKKLKDCAHAATSGAFLEIQLEDSALVPNMKVVVLRVSFETTPRSAKSNNRAKSYGRFGETGLVRFEKEQDEKNRTLHNRLFQLE